MRLFYHYVQWTSLPALHLQFLRLTILYQIMSHLLIFRAKKYGISLKRQPAWKRFGEQICHLHFIELVIWQRLPHQMKNTWYDDPHSDQPPLTLSFVWWGIVTIELLTLVLPEWPRYKPFLEAGNQIFSNGVVASEKFEKWAGNCEPSRRSPPPQNRLDEAGFEGVREKYSRVSTFSASPVEVQPLWGLPAQEGRMKKV